MRTGQAGVGPFGHRDCFEKEEKAELVFWTEGGIRKVVADVISGPDGTASVSKQVAALLRDQANSDVGADLRGAAERLAENAKSSLHRKINAIYAAHCERLEQQFPTFMDDLEKRAPDHQRRLEALETKLADVEVSCEGWLEEAQLQLERLVDKHIREFSEELTRLVKDSTDRTKTMAAKAEKKLMDLIEDRLHDLLVEAVREHAISGQFRKDGLSNKQLAAAKGISLREVKRQRHLGLI